MAEGSQLPLPFALKPPRSAAINNGRLNSSQAKTRARIREGRRDGARKRKRVGAASLEPRNSIPPRPGDRRACDSASSINVPHFRRHAGTSSTTRTIANSAQRDSLSRTWWWRPQLDRARAWSVHTAHAAHRQMLERYSYEY